MHKLKSMIASAICLIGLLSVSEYSYADGLFSDAANFKINTFGTLGVVQDSSSLHLQSDVSQPDTFNGSLSWKADTLLGVQGSAKLNDQLDATVQFIVKDRASETLNENLAWAYLRWLANDKLTVRTGRLGVDIYLLSEYRNVSFAYLWQRPPIEFYGPLLFQNFDGVDLSWKTHLANGYLTTKVFAGVSNKIMPDATGSGGNSHFGVEPLIGGKLMFENEAWRLSAGFDYIIFDQNFTDTANLVTAWSDPALQAAWHNPSLYAAQISQIGRAMSFYALGASYEKYDWTLQAEVGYLHSDWLGFRDLTSGYLSIGRHFGSLTPYTVFSMAGNVGSVAQIVPPAFQNVDINQLYTGTQAFMTGFPIDQKTVSLGLRWDALENMAFKLQWDYSLIAAKADSLWLSTTGLPNTSATNVNVFSASVVWAY